MMLGMIRESKAFLSAFRQGVREAPEGFLAPLEVHDRGVVALRKALSGIAVCHDDAIGQGLWTAPAVCRPCLGRYRGRMYSLEDEGLPGRADRTARG
jgi:hypothetical protein